MNPELLSRRIKAARILRGYSQSDLVDQIKALGATRGYSREIISRIERHGKARLEQRYVLAQALDVPLVFFEDENYDPFMMDSDRQSTRGDNP